MQLFADLEQESASLVTMKMTALLLIPELGLEERIIITLTRVETKQRAQQIMETNTSKPWDTSW